LLKAMLIAGSKSMIGGKDRSRVMAWRPGRPYRANELAIPPVANGRVYRATVSGETGSVEPAWPSPGGGSVGDHQVSWVDHDAETTVTAFPNDRQGFGRIHLEGVLSGFPARHFINQNAQPNPTLSAGQSWTQSYRVHDSSHPVRIALVWTDPPAPIPSGTYIMLSPLVNNLDLSVEFETPCSTVRYLGNDLSAAEVSSPRGCTGGTFDPDNNVEVIRFFGTANTKFTVKVAAAQATNQDFALVVYNAYIDGLIAPPGTPNGFSATATSTSQVQLSWNAVGGATSYEVQRSTGTYDSFVTLDSSSTNSYIDSSVDGERTYLYRVRSRNTTAVSDFSTVDPATTVIFDDDPLVAVSTPIKKSHLVQLRAAASAMRTAASLGAYPWTDPIITIGTTLVKADHIVDLRLAIDPARWGLGLTTSTYTDGQLTPGVSVVKAIHLHELRERVK
jgi:hypothetical protein